MRISIVGLGKLGSSTLACFANGGHSVIGVDINPDFVDKINHRIAPVDEPGLGEALRHRIPGVKWTANFSATTDLSYAIANTDITFIIVPTPSDQAGRFSLDFVLPPCKIIADAIRNKQKYHIVVITSTVMPGSTDGPIRKIFEEANLTPAQFGLVYNPEFIALGSVIRDFQNPDMLLIGAADKQDALTVKKIYDTVVNNKPYIAIMPAIEAEITKLALNTYVTTKISYANMLAQICEKIPGANVDRITQAIGADSRVGSKYLKGGLPFGGPCFPRDNRALARFMKDIRVDALLPIATDQVNQNRISDLANYVDSGKIALILGTSYKMNSSLKEQSAGTLLQSYLQAWGIEVHTWNPELGTGAVFQSLIERADVIYIMHPYPEIRRIPWDFLRGKTIVDCWREFPELKGIQNIDYIALGIGGLE